MKPPPFDYVAPESVEGVLAALAAHGAEAKLLAGGQSLVPLLNFRLARPGVLVDLNRVAALDFLRETAAGGLSFGALCRLRRLERDSLIARRAPLLTEAAPFIAHPQIRNRSTVGGSLAHADPAAELPALAVALRARVRLVSRGGERWLDAQDFFVGLLTTALEPEELLAEVEVPPLAPGTGWSFLEVARRHGDYAQAGVAALVRLDADGVCREARWVYLSAGEGPVEARQAAEMLVGERWTPERVAAAAAHAAQREIEPTTDIHATAAFKHHLAGVLTRRALEKAAERSRQALAEVRP